MPISGNSIIGANGIVLGAPATVGTLPVVSSLGPPPIVSDSQVRQWTDGAVIVVTVGSTDVRPGIGAVETFRLRNGFISSGAGTDSTVIGRGAAAPNTDAIAIGRGASTGASATESLAIGRGASAAGTPAVAIGAGASAPANNTLSIQGTSSNASNAVVIGSGAFAQSNGGSPALLSLGVSASAGRSVGGIIAMAIGNSAVAREEDLVIGHAASSSAGTAANGNTIVGHSSTANVSASFSTIVGRLSAVTAGVRSVIIGSSSSTSATQTIIIGSGVSNATANAGYFGGPSTDIQLFVIGAGNTSAAPAARTIRFTNGTGTNIAAGNLLIQAPRSTGNAASAQIRFEVGVVQASGTTLHTALEVVRFDYTATAGQTALSVYDVDTGLLQRVLVGAAGTGPGGVGRALYLA